MVDCPKGAACKNAGSPCSRCVNHSLFDPVKALKKPKRAMAKYQPYDYKQGAAEDSWKGLEAEIAENLNKVPSIEQARRTRASGALIFEKGDVLDTILFPECKERSGSKSFAIQREWLEKASKECQHMDKTMCLPFRFKGDKNIYIIFEQQDIMALVTSMKAYVADNEAKELEIKRLKQKIKELEGGG